MIFKLFLLVVMLIIYPLPSYIAVYKQHPKTLGIILVNLLGGLLLGIGWIAAMIWCFYPDQTPPKQLEYQKKPSDNTDQN